MDKAETSLQLVRHSELKNLAGKLRSSLLPPFVMVAPYLHSLSFPLSQHRHAAVLYAFERTSFHVDFGMEKLLHVIITVVKDTPKQRAYDFFFLGGFLTQAGMAFHLPEEANHYLFPHMLVSQSPAPPAPGMVSVTYLCKDRFTTYSPASPHLLLHCKVTTPMKTAQIRKLIAMFSSPNHVDHQSAPKTTVCNPHFKGKQNSVKFTLKWTSCHIYSSSET